MKVKFSFSRRFFCSTRIIEMDVPNVNVALIKLAMENDLSEIGAIYISDEYDEEEVDDEIS